MTTGRENHVKNFLKYCAEHEFVSIKIVKLVWQSKIHGVYSEIYGSRKRMTNHVVTGSQFGLTDLGWKEIDTWNDNYDFVWAIEHHIINNNITGVLLRKIFPTLDFFNELDETIKDDEHIEVEEDNITT